MAPALPADEEQHEGDDPEREENRVHDRATGDGDDEQDDADDQEQLRRLP